MQEVIKFLKEIFLMKPEDKRIGLCQFKAVEPVEKPVKKQIDRERSTAGGDSVHT